MIRNQECFASCPDILKRLGAACISILLLVFVRLAEASYEDVVKAHGDRDARALINSLESAVQNDKDNGYEVLVRRLWDAQRSRGYDYASAEQQRQIAELLARAAKDGPPETLRYLADLCAARSCANGPGKGYREDFLRKAAEMGHAEAAYLLFKSPMAIGERDNWMRRASELGWPPAQYYRAIGLLGWNGSIPDYPNTSASPATVREAIDLLRKVANSTIDEGEDMDRPGSTFPVTTAVADLGWLYYKGIGVERDYATAYGFFTRAAAGGSSIGASGLSQMYRNGHFVKQDLKIAQEWYEKSRRIQP